MMFQDLEAGRPSNLRRWGYTNGVRQQDPTQAIATGIFQINTAVSTFQQLVNILGSRRDTSELRDKLHKTRIHIGQLVRDTSDKLKQASEIVHCSEVSASKNITLARQTKNFQDVLKEFQRAQRLATEREATYTPFVAQGVLPSSSAAPEIHICSEERQEQFTLLVASRKQEVWFAENDIVFTEAFTEGREYGIEEIKQEITDLNETFKDLSDLVHYQGPMINAITSNIENSHAGTTQALTLLSEATQVKRARFSFFKPFYVAIAIVAVVAVAVIAVCAVAILLL